jgi:hypothetical protein
VAVADVTRSRIPQPDDEEHFVLPGCGDGRNGLREQTAAITKDSPKYR